MKSWTLLNLGLAALVVLLMLVVFYGPDSNSRIEGARVTALDAGEITRLMFRAEDGEVIRLVRRRDEWHLEAPISAPANEVRVEALLRKATAHSHSQFEVVEDELARYHLDSPLAVLEADDVRLEFGDTGPLDGHRYVRVGDTIHLVDDEHFDILRVGYPNFVSSRLLPEDARPVRLALPGLTLEKGAQGRWEIDPADEYSMDTLNRLVDHWVHARAIAIQRYQDAPDASPEAVITISIEGRRQALEFHVLETGGDLVLGRADLGIRYHMGEDQGRRMLDPAMATMER